MPDDAVTLTPWETSALVAHMFAVWLREHDLPWVAWEVVPELSEAAFEAFVTRAERLADQLADRCDDIIDFVVGLATPTVVAQGAPAATMPSSGSARRARCTER